MPFDTQCINSLPHSAILIKLRLSFPKNSLFSKAPRLLLFWEILPILVLFYGKIFLFGDKKFIVRKCSNIRYYQLANMGFKKPSRWVDDFLLVLWKNSALRSFHQNFQFKIFHRFLRTGWKICSLQKNKYHYCYSWQWKPKLEGLRVTFSRIFTLALHLLFMTVKNRIRETAGDIFLQFSFSISLS